MQKARTLQKRVTEEDFANVRTELACITLWSSDGHRPRPGTFEASNFRFPTLKPKLQQGRDASSGWFVSGYVRLLQSQYESKSARTVQKIIGQNLADYFSKYQALSRAVVVNSNMSRGKYLAREGPGSRLKITKLTKTRRSRR